jgi:ribosome recycling factor
MAEVKPALPANAQALLKDTESKMHKALEAVTREFATIRTGRASPALVEGLRVEYYGTPTPLKQIASINVSDPKLLIIQPGDPKDRAESEKAVLKSDLGFSPLNEGKVIRISVPPLSTERREELTKLAHKQAEEGRISLRTVRHGAKEGIEKFFKEKLIPEDEKFKGLDELEKLTHRYQAKVDELLKSKEAELKIV